MNTYHITLPMDKKTASMLRSGDTVFLTGPIYTGRDAAHQRMMAAIESGAPLPFDVTNQLIYYVGPTPARPGHPVGSAGPTSSYRMDSYTGPLLNRGLTGMIGKGRRTPELIRKMQETGAVYLGVTGGAAALVAQSIKSSRIIAYEDLGTEAIHYFEVEDFPVIVIIDSLGNNLYETGPAQYCRE